jgi:hypothetical protein
MIASSPHNHHGRRIDALLDRPMSRRATRPLAWLGLAVLAWASAANADDLFARDQNVAVLDRPHPEWDPLGVPAGAFLMYPKVVATVAYDDNILALPVFPLSDARFTVQPEITIKSDWNQNAFSLDAKGILTRYASYASQDSDQYSVTAAGALNAYHDLTLTADASHARILLTRDTDAYARFSLVPLLYDETATHLGVVGSFARFKLTAAGAFEDYRYHDGLTVSLFPPAIVPLVVTERDRDTFIGSLRGDYALSGDVALFVEETVTHSTYRRSRFRDQTQTETLVGPNFVITHLITAEIGLGYLTSDFTDPQAKSVGNFTGRAKIQYFPTELITVTLTGDQAVIDSGDPQSPAYLARSVLAEADYELLRNLIISAKLGAEWNKYVALDRYDRDFNAGLSATWRLNRGLDLGLSYGRLQRSSSGRQAGLRFDDDTVTFSINLQH